MPNPREIHRHMRSVKNIQQITKAMKMVAAARLRRAQEKASSSRPFADKITDLLNTAISDMTLAKYVSVTDHPMLAARPVRRTGFVIISADKGLAGSCNSNLLKHAMAEIKECNEVKLITVGRKAKEFFQHRGYEIADSFFGLSDKPNFDYADKIGRAAVNAFANGEVDEVKLIYTHFKSALSFSPETIQLLPVAPSSGTGSKIGESAFSYDGEEEIGRVLYEPTPDALLTELLPFYTKNTIYAALMQSAASELGARMTAMSSATDNASALLRSLELSYNKARQAGITNEINEIVGGAEALSQE